MKFVLYIDICCYIFAQTLQNCILLNSKHRVYKNRESTDQYFIIFSKLFIS
jgi:hypothetical protein